MKSQILSDDKPTTVHREEDSKAKETMKKAVSEPDNVNTDVDGNPLVSEVSVFETVEDTKVEEKHTSLNKKIRDKIDELTGRDISVVYPTNESNWDQSLLDRLNKF